MTGTELQIDGETRRGQCRGLRSLASPYPRQPLDAFQVTAEVIQDIDGDGALIAAWEARAKTFLRAVLKEGPTVGHVHHANGHARLS